MKKLVGIFVVLLFTTATADAIQIAPECKKMPDAIGCTCAIQNGGTIKPRPGGGQRWVSKLRRSGATNEAFVQCVAKARGHQ